MNVEEIKQAIKAAVQEAYPKEWLSKEELCDEFNIEATLVWKMINDPVDPLPFSTIGARKQIFRRADISDWLNRRMRNTK